MREYPALPVIAHLAFNAQHCGQLRGDGLLALPRLGVRNKQPQALEVEPIKARRKNFGVSHRGIQTEGDKKPAIGIGALNRSRHQCVALDVGEGNDPARGFR